MGVLPPIATKSPPTWPCVNRPIHARFCYAFLSDGFHMEYRIYMPQQLCVFYSRLVGVEECGNRVGLQRLPQINGTRARKKTSRFGTASIPLDHQHSHEKVVCGQSIRQPYTTENGCRIREWCGTNRAAGYCSFNLLLTSRKTLFWCAA